LQAGRIGASVRERISETEHFALFERAVTGRPALLSRDWTTR